MDDNLIKTLIEQKSDDEQDNNVKDKDLIIEEKSEDVIQDETNDKEDITEKVTEEIEIEEENFEDDISKTESLSISLSRGEGAELEEVTISDPIEIKEDIMASLVEETIGLSTSSAASTVSMQHQPIIMDKVKASPVQQQQQQQQQQQISRLLNRRKSLDPVKLREVRQELFGADYFMTTPKVL